MNDVYIFSVRPTDDPIDLIGAVADLPVTGSGTRTVTVAGPAGLKIELTAPGQSARVEGTGVETDVAFLTDGASLFLGGAGGIQELTGPISVISAVPSPRNLVTVDDSHGVYDAGTTPTYVLAGGSISAGDPAVRERFTGISNTGVSTLTIIGTTRSVTASPLFLVHDTPDGVYTSIVANGSPGGDASTAPHVAILGTSADPTSSLAISSNVPPIVSLASNSSRVIIKSREFGNRGASIRVEGVRGGGYGLGADLIILDAAYGRVDVSVANYWNPERLQGDANWFLGYDPGSAPHFGYVALRDANGPAASGIYFRPAALHSLNVDARGNRGASMMVDFRNGNPVPYDEPMLGWTDLQPQGLTYVGTAATSRGSTYALSFVGDDESLFGGEVHTAVPLYRGLITLSAALGQTRVAYQLDAGAPLFDDALAVGGYVYAYEIMDGALPDDQLRRRAPDGSIVSAAVPSELRLTAGGASIDGRPSIRIAESNPDAFMAVTRINNKARVDVQRRWSISTVATTVDYASAAAVPRLVALFVVDDSAVEFPSDDVMRLDGLPPGVEAHFIQNDGDDTAIISAAGVAPAGLVRVFGGRGRNILSINADGQRLRIDAQADELFAVVRVVAGLGEVLFAYRLYQTTPIENDPPAAPPAVDGVALQAASDVGLDGKPKR